MELGAGVTKKFDTTPFAQANRGIATSELGVISIVCGEVAVFMESRRPFRELFVAEEIVK